MELSRRKLLAGSAALGGGTAAYVYRSEILDPTTPDERCARSTWGRKLATSVIRAQVPSQLRDERKAALRESFVLDGNHLQYDEPARNGPASLSITGNYTEQQISSRIQSHLDVEPLGVSTVPLTRVLGLDGPKSPFEAHILPNRVTHLGDTDATAVPEFPEMRASAEALTAERALSRDQEALLDTILGGRGVVEVFWPPESHPTSSPRRWPAAGDGYRTVPPDEDAPEITRTSTRGFVSGNLQQSYDPSSVELTQRDGIWGLSIDFEHGRYSDFLRYVSSVSESDSPRIGTALDGARGSVRAFTDAERDVLSPDRSGDDDWISIWVPMANRTQALRAYLSASVVSPTELQFTTCE